MSHSWLGVDDMMLDKLVEDRLAEETGLDGRIDGVEGRLEESDVDRLERNRGMDSLDQTKDSCLVDNTTLNGLGHNCDLEGFKSEIVETEGMELLGFGGEEEMEALHGDEEDTEPLGRSRCNTWPTLAHHRRNAPVTSSSDEHESVSTNSPTGSVLGGVIVHPLSPPSHLPPPPGHPHLLQLQRSPSASNSGATLALVSEEGFSEGEDSHGDIPDGGGLSLQLGGVSKYKATTSMSSRRNPWGNYSYADLITQAIQSSPECRLTLSQVYDWMISNIPYFKDKGDTNSSAGWKNSIRHNLSLHQKFVRVQNEGAGKSSWWTINPEAKVGPKPPRRRALSMETSRLEKQRSRAKKRAESRLERASSSISVSSDLFPSSPANYFQHSPDFSRHRTSSNASSCGRLSPTHFRSRTLSNASSVGCNHNSPPSLVDGGLEYQDGVKIERDLDLDNIHLDNLNIDMFHEIAVKEEVAAAEDIVADSQDQMHKVKILERREPNMLNFFGQQMAPGQDQVVQDYAARRQDVTMDQLQLDYVARHREINQDQLQQDYASRRQDMGQDFTSRRPDMVQDHLHRQHQEDHLHRQHQEDLRRREMIRQQQARRPKSVVKLLEERKLEEMARIQQQARMEDMARIEETAKMEEEARREEIARIEEAERIEKLRQDEETSRREEEAAREEEAKKREMELLEEVKIKEGDPPGEISQQGVIFMKRERYRKKLMEVTLNQLKEKRVKIQRDNANISYSNKQSLLSACDIKIKLLVEQLAKYEHLDDNRLLNMDTQKELERIGEKVLITEPGLFYGENDAFMDTMDHDMDNNGLDFSSDFKPLSSVDVVEQVEVGQGDLVQQVIDHELKMEGNLDFTRSELIMYEMREPPGVPWL